MSSILLKIGYYLYVHTSFGTKLFKNELKKANDQYEDGMHSKIKILQCGLLNVTIIPYSLTNYGFIIWIEKQLGCIIIDPGDSIPFQDYLVSHNLIPKMVLITHKHHDHTYGLKSLVDLYPNMTIIGSARDGIKWATDLLTEEKGYFNFQFNLKNFEAGPSLTINYLLTPGHTVGHVIYSINVCDSWADAPDQSNSHAMYFTGDTIFMGNIGRMFECNASVYFRSICLFLESLLEMNCPLENILIFPAHEYGVVNLRFIAECLNSNNTHALSKLNWCKNMRGLNEPTIPSTIIEELSFNPFLEIVMSDNIELQTTLNEKYGGNLKFFSSEELIFNYAIPSNRRKFLLDSDNFVPVKLFKEVRKMRDVVNFKD